MSRGSPAIRSTEDAGPPLYLVALDAPRPSWLRSAAPSHLDTALRLTAIALLLRPRLLLVDEPSLGLDPRMVELVFETIVTINREGTAVLMVEQNAKKALAVSHRGFVLELGRNRFEGTGRDLLDDPDVRQHYLGG